MAMHLTEKALLGYREYTERILSYAKYKVGSTYYKVPIDEVKALANNRLAVFVVLNPKSEHTVTITEVQLYDTDNQLWLAAPESLSLKPMQEGLLYSFEIEFKEVQKQ